MITVIMASYLGEYPGAATNREMKFRRAVNSFLNQGLGELIIVSDGCEITNMIVETEYQQDNIKLVKLTKKPLFSGEVRMAGFNVASFDWICYLDSDDEFLDGHLKNIIDNLDDNLDWLYFDDFAGTVRRNVIVSPCRIGTSNIAHKKNTSAVWPDGYMHDWRFIEQLGMNTKKIDGCGYVCQHIPNKLDN